jgi:hypothetical protein
MDGFTEKLDFVSAFGGGCAIFIIPAIILFQLFVELATSLTAIVYLIFFDTKRLGNKITIYLKSEEDDAFTERL